MYFLKFVKYEKIDFVSLPTKSTLKRQEKIYKLPEAVTIPGFRKMNKKDAPQIAALLAEYLKKFTIHHVLSELEIKHVLKPQEDIVETYVVENEEKKITDFVSFYMVPCSVLKNPTVNEYKVF